MDDYENSIIRLGELVRQARTEHGLSVRELAKQIDIHHSSISRLESGQFARPTPDFLKRLARALDLELSDLYHLAGHTLPEDLPDFEVYLRTKHAHLPEAAVTELRGYYDYLKSKYGFDARGPAPGEDEAEAA